MRILRYHLLYCYCLFLMGCEAESRKSDYSKEVKTYIDVEWVQDNFTKNQGKNIDIKFFNTNMEKSSLHSNATFYVKSTYKDSVHDGCSFTVDLRKFMGEFTIEESKRDGYCKFVVGEADEVVFDVFLLSEDCQFKKNQNQKESRNEVFLCRKIIQTH